MIMCPIILVTMTMVLTMENLTTLKPYDMSNIERFFEHSIKSSSEPKLFNIAYSEDIGEGGEGSQDATRITVN